MIDKIILYGICFIEFLIIIGLIFKSWSLNEIIKILIESRDFYENQNKELFKMLNEIVKDKE